MSAGLLIFLLSFSVYLLSLTPSVNLHDSGEMITAAYSLGISHPPGYPLYCIFGKLLMSILPIGNIAYRINFFSSLSASLASMFLCFIALQLYKDKIIAIPCALIFSFSRIFWQQAVISEKYTLNALFLSLLILILLKWEEGTKAQRHKGTKLLYLFSFVLGLSFTHHLQTIFIIPSAIFLIFSTLKRKKQKKAQGFRLKASGSLILLFFFLPLLLYIYLPMRSASNPEANWGSPDTLERFISHITVKEYSHYFAPSSQWLSNFKSSLSFFPSQFTFFILIPAIIGIFIMSAKRRFEAIFFGLIIAFDILHSIRYQIHNIEDYYIPTFLVLSILLGEFLVFAKNKIKHIRAFFLLMPLIPLLTNYYSANRDRDFYSYDYGRNILEPLEKNSILLIMGDTFAFPLWYLHFVENVRCDVALIDKLELRYLWYCEDLKERYPDIAFSFQASKKADPGLIATRFVDIVHRNVEKRGIYVPLPFADEVAGTHLLIPEGIAHRILPKTLSEKGIMDEIKRSTFKFKYRKTNVFMEERTRHNYDNYAIAYEARAGFLAERGLYGEAIFCLNEAIKIDPNKTSAFYNLGILYRDSGKLDKAEEIFKEMINKFKGADGHYGLGMVYQKKNRLDDAIKEYKEAISLDPSKIFLYHSLGSVYLEKGMFDQAISAFKDALKIEPQDPNSYYNLGVTYWKAGRIEDAISAYRKVLEISPNYPGVAESLRILGG
ncbi:MAG: DUF2723 domain-containing protein [bacterium]